MKNMRALTGKPGNILSQSFQTAISVFVVTCALGIGFWVNSSIGYQAVALLLLVVISFLAITLDILPVLVVAIVSALSWNFFFIPPRFTFSIQTTEDLFLFLMYFIIAMINAVFTFKIRNRNKKLRDREDREKTIVLYDSILNSLSHELRTPIATIMGALDAMKEPEVNLNEVQKNDLLTEMTKASVRLDRQVENLLGLSRLESGMVRLRPDWIDLNEIVYKVIHTLADANMNHTIVVQAGTHLPLFKLDTIMIEQVLFNLIHNALLYTPETTTITILTSFENEKCVIQVMDNGPGFSEAAIPNAFHKFYRASETNSSGTGLGLAIAKGFIEAHSGTITLKNNPGGGANFRIEIPAETSFIQYVKNE